MPRPFGFFVHHQGRGHAERVADWVSALPADRAVTIFCARDDIFPALPPHVELRRIPSLFECVDAVPARLEAAPTPATLHCAPLGWAQITTAMAAMLGWMAEARPAVFVVDVSAELAQLCRIASVPCVKVLQHGDRDDPGHMAAYEGCVGLLAPYAAALEQPERPAWMRAKTFYAPAIGAPVAAVGREEARRRLGLDAAAEIVLVLSGAGGGGAPIAPLCMGARAMPGAQWLAIGPVAPEWHATRPGNLDLLGWTASPELYIGAADVVIAGAGNTAVHAVLAVGRPFLVIPEWRYYDEQRRKAHALCDAGAAALRETWPASPAAWAAAIAEARAIRPDLQQSLAPPGAAGQAAAWLEQLADTLWCPAIPAVAQPERTATP